MARLRQLEDPEKLRSLLDLPSILLTEARRLGPPTMAAAHDVQTAVAIDVLLHVPMRLGNLRNLRIGVQLVRGADGAVSIDIEADEIKNQVAIHARLPKDTGKLIGIYLDRYRPLLAEDGGDWFFPGKRSDVPKSDDGLRSQIQKALAQHCGLKFHPHAFRHLAAYITLKHNPGGHGQVQRILGHNSLASTMAFYSGLETSTALEHYDSLIANHRADKEPPTQPAKRAGRGR
jgi:integrase